jgi:hypothetical protein
MVHNAFIVWCLRNASTHLKCWQQQHWVEVAAGFHSDDHAGLQLSRSAQALVARPLQQWTSNNSRKGLDHQRRVK